MMRDDRGHDESQLLLVRLLTVAIGLVAGIKLLYFLPVIRAESSVAVPALFVLGLVGEFAIPVLAGVMSFGLQLRTVKRVNGAIVVGHVVAAVLALFHPGTAASAINQPWLLVAAGPLMAAVICWGPTLGSLLAALAAYAILEFPRADNAAAYEYLRATFDIQMVTVAVLGAVTAVTIGYSRRLDTLAAEASARVTTTATMRARAEILVLAAAITHDNILSTLLFGAANNPRFRHAVAEQARRALTEIERLSAETVAADSVDIADLWARVERIVVDLAPQTLIVKSGEASGTVPVVVAEATLSALFQAMTNSVAHADGTQHTSSSHHGEGTAPDTPVNRVVTLACGMSSIEVCVNDTGVGFDPALVPTSRAGIRSSITGRMAAVPGGSGVVVSEPTRGTTVTLSWQAPTLGPPRVNKVGGFLTADIFTLRMTRLLTAIFVVGQLCLCFFSTVNGGNPVASFVALVALCLPAIVLARNDFIPSRSINFLVLVGTGLAASMLFFQSLDSPVRREEFWFLTGCAFLLMCLLRSKHSWLAWVGMASMTAMAIIAATTQGVGILAGLDLITRPAVILLVGTVCSVAVSRLQHRIAAVRTETSRTLEEATFTAAASGQRQSEAVRLRLLAGPLLELLASEQELTPEQADDCIALEGALRDEVVGGRLSRRTIALAAAHARRLGVDVVLLDDGDGVNITEAEMVVVDKWMTRTLEKATAGSFVGRLPPADSPDLATIVMTDFDSVIRSSLPRQIPPFPWPDVDHSNTLVSHNK